MKTADGPITDLDSALEVSHKLKHGKPGNCCAGNTVVRPRSPPSSDPSSEFLAQTHCKLHLRQLPSLREHIHSHTKSLIQEHCPCLPDRITESGPDSAQPEE